MEETQACLRTAERTTKPAMRINSEHLCTTPPFQGSSAWGEGGGVSYSLSSQSPAAVTCSSMFFPREAMNIPAILPGKDRLDNGLAKAAYPQRAMGDQPILSILLMATSDPSKKKKKKWYCFQQWQRGADPGKSASPPSWSPAPDGSGVLRLTSQRCLLHCSLCLTSQECEGDTHIFLKSSSVHRRPHTSPSNTKQLIPIPEGPKILGQAD